MINSIFLKLPEVAQGKVFPVLASESTGISERTLRKPIESLSERTISKAKKNSFESMLSQRLKLGYSLDEAKRWMAKHPDSVSHGNICAGLVYSCQSEKITLSYTLEYAGKVDEISKRLYVARYKNNLDEFKTILLNHDISGIGNRFHNPDELERCFEDDVKEQIHSANDWSDLEFPLQVVTRHAVFSLMACWDVEFSSQYFSLFKPRPCFEMVLPKLNPSVGLDESGELHAQRDMFWYPVRRLINMMAFIGGYVREKNWPDRIPEVKRIALDADRQESDLVNWRTGRKALRTGDFQSLWRNLCGGRIHDEKGYIAPWPLFVAALLWQDLLITDDSMLLIQDDYLCYWEWHCNDLKAKGCMFGTSSWPTCFNQI